jgi:hypothetical protein
MPPHLVTGIRSEKLLSLKPNESHHNGHRRNHVRQRLRDNDASCRHTLVLAGCQEAHTMQSPQRCMHRSIVYSSSS